MIGFRAVSKSFSKKEVLRSITLSLGASQTHVFLGSSGCGKSTMVRMVAGLTLPDTGEVTVNGIRVSASTQRAIAENIGYVIQEGGLFPHLTGVDNVCLGARSRGWAPAKMRERLRELAELVRLDESVLSRFPKQMSGGQRQRVGVMRSLMLDPSILLLDEPLGALDPITRSNLQNELKRIFNSLRKTVILVTHDVGEAAYFGHSILLLENGTILQHGTMQDFVEHPASPFVTEFINAQRPNEFVRNL